MQFFSILAVASQAAAAVATADADLGWEALFESQLDEFEDRCVSVEGDALPKWVAGDFIIPSVGQFEMGGRKFVSYGDAFGKYHRFGIQGDKVCATYRMLHSGFYNESIKEGTIGKGALFEGTIPPRPCSLGKAACRVENVLAPNDNTFVNTFKVGGKLLSLTDGPFPLELDPKTLEVLGTYKFHDHLTGVAPGLSGSAHPLPHPETGAMIDFVGTDNVITGGGSVYMFSIDNDDPRTRKSLVTVPDGKPPYMHSFGVTDKYIVLPHMPVAFNAGALALSDNIEDVFKDIPITKPDENNAFRIADIQGKAEPILRKLPADYKLYYTHTINTFENASGLVIDLVTAPGNPFSQRNLTIAAILNKPQRDADPLARMTVRRFHMPLSEDGEVSMEDLTDPDMAVDFTNINPKYRGKQNCFFWGVNWLTDKQNYADMSIIKRDLCNGKDLRWQQKFWYPSEPTFISAPGADAKEDEGLIVFTALDGNSKDTYLMFLDAATMRVRSKVGPFPRIGFTTHGEFYASETSQPTKALFV
eukprot:TRINITY_DN101425_c0_g1_i1.p1 TRINITY_DN101425_c0_g1~~TRINITY_DN101425_c0_g1_i1.p1  ORF type:complete len:531 (-),score=89.69 TRINITY_DN101425_c0_g1_i1:487-2079(-)